MQITLILLFGCNTVTADGARSLPLTATSEIGFATSKEGEELLRKRDAFVNSLSRFDKQARLKTDKDVSTEQYLDFVASNVLAWNDADQRKLAGVIENIRLKLRGFELPFPKRIQLVRTSGKEEGGAAYCRGNAIVLPTNVLHRSPSQLERLLTHELFHVLSSHNPRLRNDLYAIVGFKPCGNVDFPKSLADRKITNPDAPTIEHAITLPLEGKSREAVPILYASVKNYDPAGGDSFFRFLEFRLMVVEKEGAQHRPLVREGEPVLIDPRTLEAYHDQIGRNTSYIIHPEEVLADNFVHLVDERANLSTPRIVEEMRKVLTK